MKLAPFQKEWLEEALAPGVSAAIMALPAGNGKSSFLGAVGVWALFDEGDDGAPEVPIAAIKIQQALKTCYGTALAMVDAHPELRNRAKVYTANFDIKIATPHNKGELFPISHDVAGLQGLNPSLAIIDEIGFQPVDAWGAMRARSAKRANSLIVGIGTPGFDKENALWQIRERFHSGEGIPGFVFTEYAADEGCDVHDEAQWRKANPALVAGFKTFDDMRSLAAERPEWEFRVYQLGQWVEGVECWLGSDGRKLWDSLADPYEFDTSAPTWIGIDVGLYRDSTAIAWCQHRNDDAGKARTHVKAKVWWPREDRRLYVDDVAQEVRNLCDDYNVKAVFYDPRLFEIAGEQLADEGYPMVAIKQSPEAMTPIIGTTYEAIMRGELSHDGNNQDFSTQVLNAVTRPSQHGFTLAKDSKSKGKIDAAIAMSLAVHEAVSLEPAPVEYTQTWLADFYKEI